MKLYKAVIVLRDCTHVRHILKTVPVHQIKVTLFKATTVDSYWIRPIDNPQLSFISNLYIIYDKYFDIVLIKEIPSDKANTM